jgi:single-strand DNA-binding protein
MADTYVSIAGNLTGDPELRFTTQGTAVTTCRVAVTSRTFEGGEWRDGGTSFYDVTAWREASPSTWPPAWARMPGSW